MAWQKVDDPNQTLPLFVSTAQVFFLTERDCFSSESINLNSFARSHGNSSCSQVVRHVIASTQTGAVVQGAFRMFMMENGLVDFARAV